MRFSIIASHLVIQYYDNYYDNRAYGKYWHSGDDVQTEGCSWKLALAKPSERLVKLGILAEQDKRERNKTFVAREIMDILS